MIIPLVSMIALVASASLAGRFVLRMLDPAPAGERIPVAIAFGTVLVGWCLVCAHLPAFVAEITELPLVRMPIIAALSVTAAAAVGLASVRRRRQATPAVVEKHAARQRWWRLLPAGVKWACVLPVVALHAFLFADTLLRPPAGCDSLVYHLPLVARWLQTHRLAMIDGVDFFNLPENCELWIMFFTAPKIEPLIQLSLVPVGLLLAVIVAGLSRELGATPVGAVMAVLFAMTCPMIALQMYSSYVDMFATTFLVGGLYWVIRLWRRGLGEGRPLACLVLAGLSVGIAIGARLTAWPWAAGVSLAVMVMVIRKPGMAVAPRDHGWRPAMARLAAFALAAAACSGFWYFRSAYTTGWVFHPVQLHIAGRTIGTGLPRVMHDLNLYWEDRDLACLLAYPWLEWKLSGYPYSDDSGLGVPFVTFAVPGMLYLALRKRRRARPGDLWAEWLVWGFVIGGIVLFLTIFRPATRYILPSWVTMIAASSLLLDLLLRLSRRGSVALAAIAIILSAAMIGLKPAATLAGRICDGNLSRAHAYEIPELFDQLPTGTIVLNLGRAEKNYALHGRRLSNRVIDNTIWYMRDERNLRAPLSQAQLDRHGIEIVYTQGDEPAPFARDVAYEIIYDNTIDPNRLPITPPTRVYRVLRNPLATPHG